MLDVHPEFAHEPPRNITSSLGKLRKYTWLTEEHDGEAGEYVGLSCHHQSALHFTEQV